MRLLLATDGSADAKTALEWLRCLPLPDDTHFIVLTVLEPPLLPGVPEATGELRQALLAEARTLVDDACTQLPRGAHTHARVAEGDPREEIVAAAVEWGADLVVMGARGLGAVKEFLLGSVSLGVARHAPCPVLVCKGPARSVRVVVVAQDGSADAEGAARFFAALPLAHSTRVRVAGVVEPVRYPASAPRVLAPALSAAVKQAEADRRAALERALARPVDVLRGSVAAVDVSVTVGHPAEEIVRLADVTGSDLVVVGARGLGAMKRLLLGSVSESVLRHAGCPVLVVRRTTITADAGGDRTSASEPPPTKVRDVMSTAPIVIDSAATCAEAAARMSRHRIRHLPVVRHDGTLEGICTDRDLRHYLLRAPRFGDRISATEVLSAARVGDVMASPTFVTTPDTDLLAAAATMRERRLGALPVIEGRRVVGMLTETDLLRQLVHAESCACDADIEPIIIPYP